jgi:cytidylate kinase
MLKDFPRSSRKIVIAVDGPAASGKGTLAKALAAHLGYAYLDTGALYRFVALMMLEEKSEDVEPALMMIKSGLTPDMLTNPALRSPAVAEAAAKIAAIPEVRAVVRDYQLEFAKNPPNNAPGAVIDGRDIGTVVCPDADIKFFVTASPEERARRRFEELKSRTPGLMLETIVKDVNARDHRDSSRKISPLVAADDAYTLDTTTLTPAQSLAEAISIVSLKFSAVNTPGGRKNHSPKV